MSISLPGRDFAELNRNLELFVVFLAIGAELCISKNLRPRGYRIEIDAFDVTP
jgi:hypothetical protein